ncbi:hypothetical protein MKEN_00670000 [Mycena kentingensis (nom. inval.)]|nr:hypothetical protein MKEN_00670000 [Mycena kentingensis (nom. inval.)]
MSAPNGDAELSALQEFVKTPAFDRECARKARELAALSSDEGSHSGEDDLWSSDDSETTATTVESSPHEVPKIEASLYYAGVGPKGRGPKLVYRTSEDKFEEPDGPEAYRRLMRVISVPDSHEFGQNGLWDTVRDKVVDLLDARKIKVTSVDFVRFTWLNKNKDQEIGDDDQDDDEDDDEDADVDYDDIPPIQPAEYGGRYHTNPTIWIGVVPETLTGAVAHESAKDIRTFLDSLPAHDIDIAYRESLYKTSPGHGPALFKPVEDGDPLKEVIDNVSVPLSLSIAGRKTTMQGTLGPYFHVGDKLYAITVRHNVFLREGDNELHRHHGSAPKKEVLLMGQAAFTNYLASIQAAINMYNDAAEVFETKISKFRARLQDGTGGQDMQAKLEENETELAKTRTKIDKLKQFFVEIKKRWSKTKDRVIGFVRWAPPIGVNITPHGYTRDLCVIELYKEKFKDMIGNVLSLGPELSPSKLKSLTYGRIDVPSEFKYPEDGLLRLRGMLTADQVNNPDTLDLHGDRIRRVIKRGFSTNTTVGTLTRFKSYGRKYFSTGNLESLEMPILSHENDAGAFSRGGDSGSTIVTPNGEIVAMLTGGPTSSTDSSDITYATLFEWIWELVLAEFPGANLDFDDLEAFLADVA